MNALERKNLELLAASELLEDDEREYVLSTIKQFGWAHSLTDAAVHEISEIRGNCAIRGISRKGRK